MDIPNTCISTCITCVLEHASAHVLEYASPHHSNTCITTLHQNVLRQYQHTVLHTVLIHAFNSVLRIYCNVQYHMYQSMYQYHSLIHVLVSVWICISTCISICIIFKPQSPYQDCIKYVPTVYQRQYQHQLSVALILIHVSTTTWGCINTCISETPR